MATMYVTVAQFEAGLSPRMISPIPAEEETLGYQLLSLQGQSGISFKMLVHTCLSSLARLWIFPYQKKNVL